MDSTAHKEVDSKTTGNVAQSKMHAEVFSNPDQYLNILQNDFSKLSHGHETLTLNDLQIDATDNTMNQNDRAAATISAAHYNDLLALRNQIHSPDEPDRALSGGDIDLLRDVANNQVGFDALGTEIADVTMGGIYGVAAAAGTFFLVAGPGEIAASGVAGIGLLGAASGAILVVGTAALSAYSLYSGLTESSRLSGLSQKDDQKIQSWLQ
jgi:hypothetical protein